MCQALRIIRNALVISLLAFPFVLLTFLAFLPLPSFFRWHEGDLWLYYDSGRKLMQGQLPYRTFPLEYPPLALLPFVLPHVLALGQQLSFTNYVRLFLLENALLSTLVALVLVQVVLHWQGRRNSVSVLIVYALLIALGVPLLPWRYDLFPALLTLLALLSVMISCPMLAGSWLGLGILAKLYPIFLLPIFSAYYLVGKRYRALLRMLLGSFSATILPLLPLILSEPRELLSFLLYHQMRGLQIESLPAGVIILADALRLTKAKLVHNYGALHLDSPPTNITLKLLPFLLILVFGVVLVNCLSRFWEERVRYGEITSESLVAYVVAALLAFIATNKIFSPQYIVWLLPFAPLLRLRQAVLLLAIWTITIIIFPFAYEDLLAMRPAPVLLLNLRNILVIILLLWLLVEYLPTSVRVAIVGHYRQTAKLSRLNIPWFWLGMASLFFLSAALHFWGLSRFNTLVFDEVFYAKYGNNYLNHISFFDSHPPLGKYLIAIGIWMDSHNPFSHHLLKNTLTGSLLSPFSYRWLNALTGSLIPLVVAGIAYQLSHRRSYAFIAGLMTAADGLLLVESRYALINIYLVIFGLLGQWFFLLALDNQHKQRKFWLALSGICFGASIAVKWNGLGFLVSIYLIWICSWLVRWVQSFQAAATSLSSNDLHKLTGVGTSLHKLRQLGCLSLLFNLGVIPVLVYCLAWIPHLLLNSKPDFWQLHQQILAYHQHVRSGSQEHPYCSSWYTWPLMIRPMGYLFKEFRNNPESMPSLSSSLSASIEEEVYYDVHGMGNPVLWWLSTAAIVFVLWILSQKIRAWATSLQIAVNHNPPSAPDEFWIALYLVVNYAANWLPWMKVTRCSFLYYYMGASIFAFLALAWIIERWLHSCQLWLRTIGITTVFLIMLAFLYWLPVYLGLPLSPEQFQNRMWLRSWI
jgi:predicted membrane-bound dolichyl-phosphate-mannose-protein mannosyltransferase